MVDINNNNNINGGAKTSGTSTFVDRIIANKIGRSYVLVVETRATRSTRMKVSRPWI
jgi:hypothetical protein